MRLCVFQGTFDPIHNAHLKLADFVAANFDYDKILFIPAFLPPHKEEPETDFVHRFNMVKLAIEGSKIFEVSDIESKLGGTSYTYLTILELYKKYELEGKIGFIIGEDAFNQIESWYESDKLKELVDFILFSRSANKDDFAKLRSKGYNYTYADLKFTNISSSQLRECIKDSCEFIPRKVEEYIDRNKLYEL